MPLAVVLSLGLALMLEARIPLKSEFRTFFLSPMMVPIASIILIWQVLFHYNGVVNEFLAVFGADKIDWLKSEMCIRDRGLRGCALRIAAAAELILS